jgi:hypothetical protein
VLPSVPVTITCVALTAATVKREVLPEVIDARLAMIVTVGAELDATVTVAAAETCPPTPVATAA